MYDGSDRDRVGAEADFRLQILSFLEAPPGHSPPADPSPPPRSGRCPPSRAPRVGHLPPLA